MKETNNQKYEQEQKYEEKPRDRAYIRTKGTGIQLLGHVFGFIV